MTHCFNRFDDRSFSIGRFKPGIGGYIRDIFYSYGCQTKKGVMTMTF